MMAVMVILVFGMVAIVAIAVVGMAVHMGILMEVLETDGGNGDEGIVTVIIMLILVSAMVVVGMAI